MRTRSSLRPAAHDVCILQVSIFFFKPENPSWNLQSPLRWGSLFIGLPMADLSEAFPEARSATRSSFAFLTVTNTGFHFFLKRSEKLELTVTGPYSPLQVIERFGRTRGEVARAAAVLDGVGLRLPCSGTGGTGLHELAHLVVHGRVDLGGGAQVAAAEGGVGAGKLEHGGLG